MDESPGARYRSGILLGLVAYASWGLVPLYFHAFKKDQVPAIQILAHRIVWSLVLLGLLTAISGRSRELFRVLSSPKLVAVLGLSAAVLAGNWLLYIYATVTGRVAEASLGYYMLPLVNAFLATTVLGEKLRPAHYPALALMAVGISVPVVWEGDLTWLSVSLAVSFAIYGLVRKVAPVEGLTGLTVETLLLAVPSAGFLVWMGDAGHFGRDVSLDALLMFGAVVTVIPLLTFTISLRRMPLLANSFLQFVSPTVQLLIAVAWIGEDVAPDRWVAMGFVLTAAVIFLGDAAYQLSGAGKRITDADAADDTPRIKTGIRTKISV